MQTKYKETEPCFVTLRGRILRNKPVTKLSYQDECNVTINIYHT